MGVYKTRVFNNEGRVIKSFSNERESSPGEIKIQRWLNKNKVRYKKEKTFPWLLGANNGEMRLDFYLPDFKIAIEFDGSRHDTCEYQKKNDHLKNYYVKKHGIRMIRIHYLRFYLIDKILERYIPIVKNQLNKKKK